MAPTEKQWYRLAAEGIVPIVKALGYIKKLHLRQELEYGKPIRGGSI